MCIRDRAKSGSITWNGKELNKMKSHEVTKSGLSLCPEGRQLFPEMTVHENLIMGAYTRTDKNEIAESIEEVFGWFPRLKDRSNQQAGTLSGGEQEMLAIARALMAKPDLLMLDEPSWGLAPILVEEVGDNSIFCVFSIFFNFLSKFSIAFIFLYSLNSINFSAMVNLWASIFVKNKSDNLQFYNRFFLLPSLLII